MKVKLDKLIEECPELVELAICSDLDPSKIAIA